MAKNPPKGRAGGKTRAERPVFRCTECGATALRWVGRCGECQAWGTVQEAGGSESV